MEVGWASAPHDILECMVSKLRSIDEYVLFGSVCRPWLAFLINHHKPWQDLTLTLARPPQSPLLLVPSDDGRRDIRKLYNVFDGKTYTLPLTVRYNRRCCGSSHGWLAIFRRTMSITLVNPTSATERRIVLPPIMKRPKYQITSDRPFTFYCWVAKVVLSHDPDLVPPRDCVVAVIENSYLTLAFMRLSDRQWTFVDTQHSLLCDVVFCDGFLYAADLYGMLIRINQLTGDNKVEVVVPRFFEEQTYKVYTVKSIISGDILVIRRSVGHDEDAPLLTTGFRVYRLVESGGVWKWIEVNKLNDGEVLFVGDNESMSVSCAEIGGSFKANCIYYTDDSFDDGHYREQGPNDMGVYNLEDTSFDPTYILNPWEKNFPPPIFFVPKLFGNGSSKNIQTCFSNFLAIINL